jgi:hypothetical protein
MYSNCECGLDIIGPREEADALRRLVTTTESEFDFNAVVPMPSGLRTVEPSDVANEAWLLKYGNWKHCRRFGPPKYATRREAIAAARRAQSWWMLHEWADEVDRRIREYGHPDRCFWAKENWGTELPACGVEWIAPAGAESRGSAHTVFFETDLTVPAPVIAALSRRFPALTLRLSYAEPENDTRGFMTFTAGRIGARRAELFVFRNEWQVFISHDLADLAEGIYIGDAKPAADDVPSLPRSKWANPFVGGGRTPTEAEVLYERWISGSAEAAALVPPGNWHRPVWGEIRDELRGTLLVCDCDEQHCHGYFLAFIGGVIDDDDEDEDDPGPQADLRVVSP